LRQWKAIDACSSLERMCHRRVGFRSLAFGWFVTGGLALGCADGGGTDGNSSSSDSGTTAEDGDARVLGTQSTSSNGDAATANPDTSSIDAGISTNGEESSESTRVSDDAGSVSQASTAPRDGGVTTSTHGGNDASLTTDVHSTATSESTPTTSSNPTSNSIPPDTVSSSNDDASDGGTNVVVELPPRPEPTIPAVPSFAFDETSCEAPRMGTQTIELQADIIDLDGIDCILGDLNIWPTSLIDLSGLESLRYVRGDVLVGVSQSLNSFSGLASLETIGGSLTIQQTPVLVSATGLSGLKRVGGDVRILQNVTLQTLNGLDALEAIGGSLVLTDNQNLNLLGDGLAALTYVGGLFTLKNNPYLLGLSLDAFEHAAGGLYVSDNAALSNITLPELKYSGADIVLTNGATTTIDMSGLEATLGDLHVSLNDEGVPFSDLASADFGALEVVGGELFVSGGADLLALAWPELVFVDGNLLLGAAEAVLDLDLPKLARVGGDLRLQNLDRLRSVELPNLIQVGGTLALTGGDRLENAHFPELVSVTELVSATQLPILQTLELPGLVTAGGFTLEQCGQELLSLETVDVSSLRTLTDEWYVAYSSGSPTFIAPELTDVGAFAFEYNDFVSIEGFPKLASIAADLVVQHHEQLIEVRGFDNLTSVGGDVWILDNQQLGDLTGFERLSTVTGMLTFEELPVLSRIVLQVSSLAELHVTDCGMGTVALPELVSAYVLLFNDNSGLTCLHLPKLSTMEPISFGNSPIFAVNSSFSMPACQVDAIRAQINADDLIYSNSFTDTTATCSGESCF
jgi:hypothetical protein